MSAEKYSSLPEDLLPSINELPGDLYHLAEVIEEIVPGKGVLIVISLADEYRGTSLYFHNLDALKRKSRDRNIVEQYDNGKRPSDIARNVGLSERQIWKILGCKEHNRKQMSLF